jgi:epoxyqueuosine reductase QueG
MKVEKKIVAEAQRLFDVVGVTPYGRDSLLILGLVTTPQHDLDDFLRDEDGAFRLHGFEVHAQPRLDLLTHFIREQGLEAEIWGPHGYPQGKELNLKQQAVAAGLGMWGKNSLMLHPQFGPWLRLMAVKVIGASLSPTGPGRDSHEENPLCKDCTTCIEACPEGILEPYYLRDRSSCRAEVSKLTQKGKLIACDQCWVVCPIGRNSL